MENAEEKTDSTEEEDQDCKTNVEDIRRITSKSELFLYRSKITSLLNMHKLFSELVKLTVIGQPEMQTLSGIESIPLLKELWVAECGIEDTSAVMNCCRLEKLYLYSNKIKSIPVLNASKEKLQVLWLSGNQIAHIENLEELTVLEDLNLGNNVIYEIGSSLQQNFKLIALNLSGNPIYSIKDLCKLARLASLKSLQFADLLYGECPITQMCNYRPYAIYHLPNVEVLDQFPIQNGERQLVQELYARKRRQYANFHQQLLNTYYKTTENKEEENRQMLGQYRESMYLYTLKELERKMRPEHSHDISDEHTAIKLAHLPLKLKKWEMHLQDWNKLQQQNRKMKEAELNCELETAGNITFSDSTGDLEFENACQILLTHYVCAQARRKYEVKGVEICKVIQAKNKELELLWRAMNKNGTKSSKTMLMLLHRPGSGQDKSLWPYETCKKGFVTMEEYSLEITDCLTFNDSTWLEGMSKRSLLSAMTQEYGKERHICLIVKLPSNIRLKRIQKKTPKQDMALPTQEERSCNIYQVSNPKAVIPVCIVEYTYIIENTLEACKRRLGWSCDIHAGQLTPVDLPTYPVLNEIALTKILHEESKIDKITELTLTGCGIKSIGTLPEYPNIVTLNISYNKLTNVSELKPFIGLKQLDISFNSVYSLDNCEDFPHLETLNISWNQINKFFKFLLTLKKRMPKLIDLNILHNPLDITKKEHVFYLTHQKFPNLETLNELDISKSIIKDLAVIDLEKSDMLSKGKTIPKSMYTETAHLKWKAEICNEIWNKQGEASYVGNADSNSLKWISLQEKYITDVKSPNVLANTLWIDFSHNLLSNVDFLAEARMLQELSLANNMIQKLGVWVHNMRYLAKLDLSCNYITSLKPFYGTDYPNLKVLNVSNNWIKSLMGIENCEALEELYASHNSITELDDLHGVKNCKIIQILDLTSNPVESHKEMSKFVTFHLPKLEVLNGKYIDSNYISEVHGECLDEDYFIRYHSNGDHRNMTELTLTDCQIKKISVPGDLLPNLTSLDLQYNKISSLWNFRSFPSLQTLRLSYNQVTKMKQSSDPDDEKRGKIFFPKLKTLFLDNNNIINLSSLHLTKLKNLESLFLQNNELITACDLQDITTLRYLVLDRNRLERVYPEECLQANLLQELYVERNKIQLLGFVRQLKALQRLFIGKNEISDPEELRHLKSLRNLYEIGVLGNPMCRKQNFYLALNQYTSQVTIVDGVTTEQLTDCSAAVTKSIPVLTVLTSPASATLAATSPASAAAVSPSPHKQPAL